MPGTVLELDTLMHLHQMLSTAPWDGGYDPCFVRRLKFYAVRDPAGNRWWLRRVNQREFKEWTIYRGVNRVKGTQVTMEPWGISNSWKSLSPLGLKGRRRRDWPRQETAGARRVRWSKHCLTTRQRGGGEGIEVSSLSHCFHPLGPNTAFQWPKPLKHLDEGRNT